MWNLYINGAAALQPSIEHLLEGQALCSGELNHHQATIGEKQLYFLLPHQPNTAELEMRLSLLATMHQCAQPRLKIEQVPERDWLQYTYQEFQPFKIGRFHIYGSHTTPTLAEDDIDLCINAATAFGSGEHPTTQGCLKLLQQLKAAPRRILDLGCGSGILALAAAKLYPMAKVTVLDIDPEAIRVTRHNFALNQVYPPTTLLVEDNDLVSLLEGQQYDLIFANIVLDVLKELGSQIYKSLALKGKVIASGILTSQVKDLVSTYQPLGFHYERQEGHNNWAAVELGRS